ncbi:MAG TPA: alpha/beta fold hydrolase [Longimicrobiales bacterium]|nr:alpha/beta fold hydrolase [Longimicrobiales bacterium]
MPPLDSAPCPGGAEPATLAGVRACVAELDFRAGDLRLAGRWFTPRPERPGDGEPLPAAVIVPGSGPSRRGHPWTEMMAAPFLRSGLGVLLPDKRGSERSEGDWRAATYEDLAEDAVAAVASLRRRPDVQRERIGVVGLSEGGQVVAVAAARDPDVAFVVNAVGGATAFIPKVKYEMRSAFVEAGLDGRRLEVAERMLELAAGHVLGGVSWTEYETELEAARPALGPLADTFFLSEPDHWRWAFLRAHSDWDPIPWWLRVRQPVLVLYGELDTNQPSADGAARLEEAFRRAGHPDATVRVFPGLGHSLRSGAGLDPEVEGTLARWLAERLDTNRTGGR